MATGGGESSAEMTFSNLIDPDTLDEIIETVLSCDDLEQTRTLSFWVRFKEEHNFRGEPKALHEYYMNNLVLSQSSQLSDDSEIDEVAKSTQVRNVPRSYSSTSFKGNVSSLPNPEDMQLHQKMLCYVYAKKAIDLARNVRFWHQFTIECGIEQDPFNLKIWFWSYIVLNPDKYENLLEEEREYFQRRNFTMAVPFDLTEIKENSDIIAERFQHVPIHTRTVVVPKRIPQSVSRLARENPSAFQGTPPLVIVPLGDADESVNGIKIKQPSKSFLKAKDEFIEAISKGIMHPDRARLGRYYSIGKIKKVTLEILVYGNHPGDISNKNTWQYYALNDLPLPSRFNMDEFK